MNHRDAEDTQKSPKMAWLLGVLCVSVVLIAGFLIWRQWFETYHLAVVDPGKLYRDGNRGVREYANTLRKVRPKTVVTLIDDEELAHGAKPEFAAEAQLVQQRRDIELVRIPVPLGGWPDGDQIDRFLAIATDPAKQPVVVHCAQGVRRTGMLAAAYQMSVLGFSKQRAKAEMLTFGHSMRTVGDVQRFIDVYDPQARRMAESLPRSKE
jgi:protein-tyrosine phosphatase